MAGDYFERRALYLYCFEIEERMTVGAHAQHVREIIRTSIAQAAHVMRLGVDFAGGKQ
jgi:hypothetical protein